MKEELINIFEKEISCTYREEVYLVRDNGAVLRRAKKGKRHRPKDEKWTFGELNKQKGYLSFASEAVHRIVATAFHGEQPTDKHIVDHIDTNRQNNRPENLRWVTRLENILLNTNTLSKILYLYGSIDNFLANPGKPLNGNLDQNFDWMRTVTKEEAENTRTNLLNLGKAGKVHRGGVLGEWIFSKLDRESTEANEHDFQVQSLTINAFQKNWKIPTEFPLCPDLINDNSLIKYKNSLVENKIFSKNKYGVSKVISSDYVERMNKVFVLTFDENPEAAKKFALASIFIENKSFIHENLGAFFERNGAEKKYYTVRGLEWEGGDSIDDYC